MKNPSHKIHTISFPLLLLLASACSDKGKEAPKQATLEARGEEPIKAEPDAKSFWLTSLPEAQAQAAAKQRPLFIDFSATWCAPCADLEETFRAPHVSALLQEKFVALKLDVTDQSEADKSLMAQFSVSALPALLVVNQGTEVLRIDTFVGPEALETALQGALQPDEGPKEPL